MRRPNLSDGTLLHATAVALAVDADGPRPGVLLLGPSGAGKSSLALSLIESCPFRRTALVADDQVLIDRSGHALAPPKLLGLIEVRGYGPAPARSVASARLAVAFDLGLPSERTPQSQSLEIAPGLRLPRFPFRWTGSEASAAHRLRVIVRQVLCGQTGEEPQDMGAQKG